ncbi:hypothetical protein HMPREF1586_00980 [Gardnerella vaginalis JCP8522]|nr:hypothetical protein HMPREF1586_00980 [Gardnerella vaginalis JCP8522]
MRLRSGTGFSLTICSRLWFAHTQTTRCCGFRDTRVTKNTSLTT